MRLHEVGLRFVGFNFESDDTVRDVSDVDEGNIGFFDNIVEYKLVLRIDIYQGDEAFIWIDHYLFSQ